MNETILVVDDDPGVLNLLEFILLRKGYTVLTERGAQRALKLIDREKADLFILDVMMPGMSGFELCERLRAQSETALTPIILLSGLSDHESIEHGYAVGANEYMTKMTSHVQLVSKVEQLLRESRERLGKAC